VTDRHVPVRRGRYVVYVPSEIATGERERRADQLIASTVRPGAADRAWMGRGGRLSVVRTRVEGRHAVVRRFTHGGLLRKILPDLTLGRGRGLREMRIVAHALDNGVPTPPILGVVFERRFGTLYRMHVVTEEALGACNLTEFFLQLPMLDGRLAARRERAAIEAVGRTLARLHRAGIYHGDLHLRNLLVRLPAIEERHCLTERTAAYVLDFDRARLVSGLGERLRRRNLRRLVRSLRKVRPVGDRFSLRDAVRFLREYLGTRDRSVIAAWLRALARPARGHRLWWALTGATRPARTVEAAAPARPAATGEHPGGAP